MKYLFAAAAFAFLAANALSLGVQNITVQPSACQALTAQTPRDAVTYRPDLNAPGQLEFDADHELFLPIELPLENALAIAVADNLNIVRYFNIGVGTVTVKNGQAYFNDQPLGDAQSHAIAVECRKQ